VVVCNGSCQTRRCSGHLSNTTLGYKPLHSAYARQMLDRSLLLVRSHARESVTLLPISPEKSPQEAGSQLPTQQLTSCYALGSPLQVHHSCLSTVAAHVHAAGGGMAYPGELQYTQQRRCIHLHATPVCMDMFSLSVRATFSRHGHL